MSQSAMSDAAPDNPGSLEAFQKSFETAADRGDIEKMISLSFDESAKKQRWKNIYAAVKEATQTIFSKHLAKAGGEQQVQYAAGTHWAITSLLRELGATQQEDRLNHYLLMRIHKTRIVELEKRIAALESQAATKNFNLADVYCGTWQAGDSHTRGTLITHDGSLWLAMENTERRPGDTVAWRLITKRGKDAR